MIVAAGVSGISIVGSIIFIRRNFFGSTKIEDEAQLDDINELELGWRHRKQYNIDLVRYKAEELKKQNNSKEI